MTTRKATVVALVATAFVLLGLGAFGPYLLKKKTVSPALQVVTEQSKPVGEEVAEATVQTIEANLKSGETPWSFTAFALKSLGLDPSLQFKAVQLVVRYNSIAVLVWNITGNDLDTRLAVGRKLSVKVEDLMVLARYEVVASPQEAVGEANNLAENSAPTLEIVFSEDGTETRSENGVVKTTVVHAAPQGSGFAPALPAILLVAVGVVAFKQSRKGPKEASMRRTLSIAVFLAAVLGLSACGGDSPTSSSSLPLPENGEVVGTTSVETTPSPSPTTVATPVPDSNPFVGRYSQGVLTVTNTLGGVGATLISSCAYALPENDFLGGEGYAVIEDGATVEIKLSAKVCGKKYQLDAVRGACPARVSGLGGLITYKGEWQAPPCVEPTPEPTPPPPLTCVTETPEIARGDEFRVRATSGVAPFEYKLDGVTILPVPGQDLVLGRTDVVGDHIIQISDAVRPARTVSCKFRVKDDPSLSCSPAIQPNVMVGQWSQDITAAGGTGQYGWTSNGGVLSVTSGVSTKLKSDAVGTFDVMVSSGSKKSVCRVTVVKPPDPALACSPTTQETEVNQLSRDIVATGGNGSYIWTTGYGSLTNLEGNRTKFKSDQPGDFRVIVQSGGQSKTCSVLVKAKPPTCEELNPPKGTLTFFGGQGDTVSASFRIENAGEWHVYMYATSSLSEYEADRPDHEKRHEKMTLDCGQKWVPTLSYVWKGHPSKYWWVVIKRGNQVWLKTPYLVNPHL